MKRTMRKRALIMLFACMFACCGAVLLQQHTCATEAFASESGTPSIEEVLTFNLINNEAYKVTAKNKQIVEVEIPEEYNGLPVTEIADNGFLGCTNLKSVYIPSTVTTIGNNAFANCQNLEKINGLSHMQDIGGNAFAMCLKLDKVILPTTLTSVGNTIFRNNPNTVYCRMSEAEMNALNPNWMPANSPTTVIYGNEIVLSEIQEDGEIIGYAVEMSQNISEFNADFVLGDTYNGLPLLGISDSAFSFNSFHSFTLKHGEIIPDEEQVANVAEFSADVAESCNHSVNIASNAFLLTNVEEIHLLVDVTFDDPSVTGYSEFENGHSASVFAGSTLQKITLPDSLTCIPVSFFDKCNNLTTILNTNPDIPENTLSAGITGIGSQAFTQCYALEELFIPDSVINMGNAVFSDWGETRQQTVYFYEMQEIPTDGSWDMNWQGTTQPNAQFKFEEAVLILFDKDGGTGGSDSVTAFFHQDMPAAVAPVKPDSTFDGYYDQRNGQGKQYYDGEMNSVNRWDKHAPSILYANWETESYLITFNKQGGSGGSDFVLAALGEEMPEAVAPTLTGYDFRGYFTQEEGEGTQYYDLNMEGTRPWDLTEDTMLYADWKEKEYIVYLVPQNGEENDKITAEYGKPMPSAPVPILAGKVFQGYYTEPGGQGTKYYEADMTSAKNWDIDSEDAVFLYAHYEPAKYKITFERGEGSVGGTEYVENVLFGGVLPGDLIAPTRDYYTFEGYYTMSDGYGVRYYDEEMLPTHYMEVAQNLTLYAYWVPIEYHITYVLNGGLNNGGNPSTYTVAERVILKQATHPTLYFDYWTLNGEPLSNLDGISGNITLEAHYSYVKNEYYASGMIQLNVSDERVNVILGENVLGQYSIHVAPTTKSLIIDGEGKVYKMKIWISSRTSPIDLKLRDIGIIGMMEDPAIRMDGNQTLNLYTSGMVFIKGGQVADMLTPEVLHGCPAISCGTLKIQSSDYLIIEGGDGADGFYGNPQGGPGGSAAVAIVVQFDVYINCSYVVISAGEAGRGGNGMPIGYGGNGANPVAGRSPNSNLYIDEDAEFIFLYRSADGEDGIGMDDFIPYFPTDPPTWGGIGTGDAGDDDGYYEIENPDICLGDLNLPPIGGGGTLPPPEIMFPQD